MLRRMFALPPGTVPVVLTVDVRDRVLTVAFQAAGAAMAALYLASPGPGDAPEHRAGLREAVDFGIMEVLVAGGRAPDQYRGRANPEGQEFLTPAPGARLYICGAPQTRLERFALTVTGPDRAADGDRLAAAHAAHAYVPLGEGAPFGHGPRPVLQGLRSADEAPAGLSGRAAYALPWSTARRRYSVACPPHPRAHSLFRGERRPKAGVSRMNGVLSG